MKPNLNHYRLAGVVGGLLLAAGQFWGPACVLQLAALVPLMVLVLKDRRIAPAMLAAFYMGIAYTLPQMVYLCMPVPVTVILLVWMTLLLTGLCLAIAYFLPKHIILGPLAVGAVWYILDWVNYTAIPIWGLAQSFARSWTAYPFAIQFIAVTGISGVLFVVAVLSGLAAYCIVLIGKTPLLFKDRWPKAGVVAPATDSPNSFLTGVSNDNPLPPSGYWPFAGGEFLNCCYSAAFIVLTLATVDTFIWFQKPTATLRVAAAGWVFDDRTSELNPNEPDGFEAWFATPARYAASQGARIFTTGEMGFYIAKHEWDRRIADFAAVARQNNLWLIVGYFNVTDDENRVFFMNPDGQIVHEYTKTYLTPYEPGKKGTGDLKTVTVDGLTIGAMICQDDNFSRLTRRYARLKADLVLCPTADWWTIKNAHLQAVRARAIEGNYSIARGAACGISAIISPRGEILVKLDHYNSGPGFVIADVPIRKNKTLFARFGHWPGLIVAAMLILAAIINKSPKRQRRDAISENQSSQTPLDPGA